MLKAMTRVEMAEKKKPERPDVRVSLELRDLIKLEAYKAGMQMGDFLEAAVKHYLACSGKPKIAAVPAGPHADHLKKLAEILSSGDTAAIDAIIANVEVFYARLKPKPPN